MDAHGHTIIPESENHCVWMDAGLVNYKLCTTSFRCDTCPFDGEMKKQHHSFAERAARSSQQLFSGVHPAVPEQEAADRITDLLRPLLTAEFPEDRIYFANHTWMKTTGRREVLVGIDRFLASLLSPVVGVATAHAPSHLHWNEPFAWIIRDSSALAVRAGQQGILSSVNPELIRNPSLLTSDPYGSGWLIVLSHAGHAMRPTVFFSSEEFRERSQRDTAVFKQECEVRRSIAGMTMHDGGAPVEHLEKLIGEKRYTAIVSGLMSLH